MMDKKRKTGYDSDVPDFLGRLKNAEERLPEVRIPDVRSAVWDRIGIAKNGEAAKNGAVASTDYPCGFSRSLTRWEVAAAVAAVAGAGVLYQCAGSVMSEMYWSGSLHMLTYLF